MTDEFIWTDELVMQFIYRGTTPIQDFFIQRSIDDFKKQKQKQPLFTTEQEERILELIKCNK